MKLPINKYINIRFGILLTSHIRGGLPRLFRGDFGSDLIIPFWSGHGLILSVSNGFAAERFNHATWERRHR